MMPSFFKISCFALLLQSFSCQSQQHAATEQPVVLHIDTHQVFQSMANFGASDAWSGQFVGLWPDAKRNAMADLLFSQELDNAGNPKGIGLSLWRFNLGAGSAEQGRKSGIRDSWRRAPTFWDGSGYDWDKLDSQVWLARAAQKRGADQLLMFLNSPPVHLTRNGRAYTSDKTESNIAPENYPAFATYLADIIEGMRAKNVEVDYVSPFNEPQWDWADGGQEGNPYWNKDIFEISKAIDSVFQDRKIATTIDIAEAAQIDYLYKTGKKPGRGDQIEAFFSEQSPYYLGNLKSMGHAISGHSYFTTSPASVRVKKREQLRNKLNEVPDLDYWMSEYCILGANAGEIEGYKLDLGMTSALYLAEVIHSDLVDAQASAWHWWTAISAYDYKDGLIYIDKNEQDGNFYESKMLWVLGNYSRFIRPGFKRVAIAQRGGSKAEELMYSAYTNPDQSQLVLVLINDSAKEKSLSLSLPENFATQSFKTYTTSATEDLQFKAVESQQIAVPAESVMTVVIDN